MCAELVLGPVNTATWRFSRVEVLDAVGKYGHENLAIDVAGSICSPQAIEILSQLIILRDAPRALCLDSGMELVTRACCAGPPAWGWHGIDRHCGQAAAERRYRELQW